MAITIQTTNSIVIFIRWKKTSDPCGFGNYKNKLTWVSTDGISVSFEDGVLIATRGYSQDLMESNHENLNNLLNLSSKTRNKTYRYLNGQNEYEDIKFSCSISVKKNYFSNFRP